MQPAADKSLTHRLFCASIPPFTFISLICCHDCHSLLRLDFLFFCACILSFRCRLIPEPRENSGPTIVSSLWKLLSLLLLDDPPVKGLTTSLISFPFCFVSLVILQDFLVHRAAQFLSIFVDTLLADASPLHHFLRVLTLLYVCCFSPTSLWTNLLSCCCFLFQPTSSSFACGQEPALVYFVPSQLVASLLYVVLL